MQKSQLIRNVQSRKLNMSILATPPSLPRLPSVKGSDLGSDLIKVGHLLILFTPFFLVAPRGLWDLVPQPRAETQALSSESTES